MQGSYRFWDRSKVLILIALAVVLGVPFIFALARDGVDTPSNAERLVIVTPHNEQIRLEFHRAFSRWHEEHYGTPIVIDWRQPGGTSEIRKQLESQYITALRDGVILPDGTMAPGMSMVYDLMFGGGSYEHDQLKRGVSFRLHGPDEPATTLSINTPVALSAAELHDIFGENKIGAGHLYDPDGYWVGSALSGFGIIYNRNTLKDLGLPEPRSWEDIADPRYTGWLALADPRMSGSVTTTYDSILNYHGWDGWRILQAMSANARYFSNNASKIPVDVSQGEAAAGVSIDFYGRYQSQAVMREGETPQTTRVGYIDPPGVTYIDADPISKLLGAPNDEIADRFIRFVLSEQGQALWQFRATGRGAPEDQLGPRQYELRRMPVLREMYERRDLFVDSEIDPFQTAMETASRGWRSAVAPMMAAFSCDIHRDQVRAWTALNRVRAAVDLGQVPYDSYQRLEDLFYQMPSHTFPADFPIAELAGRTLEFNEANYRTIRLDWAGSRPLEAQPVLGGRPRAETQIAYTTHFRRNYREIVRLAGQLLR
jgi:ABC-type Fe3+ transport system substrate-binding protein